MKTNIKETLISYLEKMSLSLGAIFTESYKRQLFLKEQLYAEFHTVRKKALSIRYEVLFHRLNTLDFNSLWTQILFCTQYLANLIESYQWLSSYLNEEEKEDIEVAIKTTQYNIQTIIEVLQGSKSTNMIPAHNLLDILKHAITTEPTRFAALENEALGFYNLMYFFARLNTRLHETYILLQQTI